MQRLPRARQQPRATRAARPSTTRDARSRGSPPGSLAGAIRSSFSAPRPHPPRRIAPPRLMPRGALKHRSRAAYAEHRGTVVAVSAIPAVRTRNPRRSRGSTRRWRASPASQPSSARQLRVHGATNASAGPSPQAHTACARHVPGVIAGSTPAPTPAGVSYVAAAERTPASTRSRVVGPSSRRASAVQPEREALTRASPSSRSRDHHRPRQTPPPAPRAARRRDIGREAVRKPGGGSTLSDPGERDDPRGDAERG